MQLGLVEAAHIVPVSVDGSTDHVQNGLSLLPQFHRAFDSGLIYLTTEYIMKVNDGRARQLQANGLDSGLDELRRTLGRIALPKMQRHWPDKALIRKANKARGIR